MLRALLIASTLMLMVTVTVAVQLPMRSVWDGVYTDEQADAGREVYVEACSSCHGNGLGGVEAAPALIGPTFTANWNGTTLNDLATRIQISMPADDPGSLSRRRVAELVAYMLAVSGFPAGEFVLGRQAAVLQQILYLSTPPD